MTKNQHNPDSTQFTQNQNNQMSENDPRDGSRNSATLGRDGKPTPAERPPEQYRQDRSVIDERGRQGAATASKDRGDE